MAVPSLPENVKHKITKDGREVTKRFKIEENNIVFKQVKLSDNGFYTISCTQEGEVVAEETLELEVTRSNPPVTERELSNAGEFA